MFGWQLGIWDVVDIALVAVVVYYILRLIRGTRAEQMLIGLAVVLLVYELARVFGLLTVEWIFSQFFSAFIIILVVLFQHEIRRGLMHVAANPLISSGNTLSSNLVEPLVESALSLVHRGWGGLLVIERETGLKNLYETGVELDAELRPDMVQAIFCPQAPMHDGALIVTHTEQGFRIAAARVLLPLAQANAVPGSFGTRHRAAVGVSEESDALIIVVSEELQQIHLVEEGQMSGPFDADALRVRLREILMPDLHAQTEGQD